MENARQRQVNTESSVPACYIITPVIFVVKVKWVTEKPCTYVFLTDKRAENSALSLYKKTRVQSCGLEWLGVYGPDGSHSQLSLFLY